MTSRMVLKSGASKFYAPHHHYAFRTQIKFDLKEILWTLYYKGYLEFLR